MATTGDALKKAVRDRIAVFNDGDLARFGTFMAPASMSYFPGLPPMNYEGFQGLIAGFRSAFPDLEITVDSQVAEGDTVATVWTARGTHQGDLQGIAPTGRTVNLHGVTIDRFEGGGVIEHREFFDQLAFMQQLGVIPAG
jgi:predicted ester cyclase